VVVVVLMQEYREKPLVVGVVAGERPLDTMVV
jgi:hypothetical protein